ncbi:hypothetical protein MHYP_G00286020 [Metynnis hypsauchen]
MGRLGAAAPISRRVEAEVTSPEARGHAVRGQAAVMEWGLGNAYANSRKACCPVLAPRVLFLLIHQSTPGPTHTVPRDPQRQHGREAGPAALRDTEPDGCLLISLTEAKNRSWDE